MNIRLSGSAVLAIAAIAAGVWYWNSRNAELPSPKDKSSIGTFSVPTIIETNGGQLTVAIVKVTGEQFVKNDPRYVLGISLGTTTSKVQADVTYRYHIEMARRWPIEVDGKTAMVRAPEIKPSLPVAFDTATVRKQTESGWARFNKDENLHSLEKSITQQIQVRASSPQYEQIKKDAARETVRVFVSTWLLSQQGWGKPPEYRVVVLFPGESLADAKETSAPK